MYKGRYEGIEEDVKRMLVLACYYWAMSALEVRNGSQRVDRLKLCEARMNLCDHYYENCNGKKGN